MRGYGQSSCPKELEHYGNKNVTSDLAHLLDALNLPRAVFIGHDWGGAAVWRMCLFHPDRVIAVGGILTPFAPPRDQYIDLETYSTFLPQLKYQLLMADTAQSSKILDPSPSRILTATFRYHSEIDKTEPFEQLVKGVVDSDDARYTKRSPLLTQEELDYYVQAFTNTGFTACLNYYGTRAIDFETERDLPRTIEHPALYIGAANDHILMPALAAKMPLSVPNLDMKIVDDAGHWVLWEQREQVTAILEEWLAKVADKPTAP